MSEATRTDSSTLIKIVGLSFFVNVLLFSWQGSKGFSLWDEGFLWYGAQRVMRGEIPIRDFMAYDPGRYYWSAAVMRLCGNDSIMALRAAVALFQTVGLFVGLLLITSTKKNQNFLYLILSAITLVVWMYPRHKLFDISLSIILIGTLAFLVQNATKRRYFSTGVCVGLVAIFGRNHGMYAVAGCLGVMLWLCIKRNEGPGLLSGLALWTAGIVTGFIPIYLMALSAPGFATAFYDSIRFLFEVKATNLPLPIPWPWLVNFHLISVGESIRAVLTGLFFITIIVFGVLSIAWVVRQKLQNRYVSPSLVAASFLALPYAHYAYSRADVGHLAQGIFPFLIGSLILLAAQPTKVKWPLAIFLCTASVWVLHVFHPGWQCYINKQCVNIEVNGDNIQVDPGTADDVALLRKLSDKYTFNDQSFIAAPFWPGAYALLKRKSPMWEIYALFPRTKAFEMIEIERIKTAKPGFALIYDLPLDGHDELRFKNTHPLIHQYIVENFEKLPNSVNQAYQIYRAKGPAQ